MRYPCRMSVEFRTHFVLAVCALLPAMWCLPAAAEDAMRCGSRLITEGDAKDKVRTLCGEPTDIAFRGVVRRSPSYRYGSWPYEHDYRGPGWEEMPVEIWTYNLGSHKLLRKLRFVGDRLEEIETDGYGY